MKLSLALLFFAAPAVATALVKTSNLDYYDGNDDPNVHDYFGEVTVFVPKEYEWSGESLSIFEDSLIKSTAESHPQGDFDMTRAEIYEVEEIQETTMLVLPQELEQDHDVLEDEEAYFLEDEEIDPKLDRHRRRKGKCSSRLRHNHCIRKRFVKTVVRFYTRLRCRDCYTADYGEEATLLSSNSTLHKKYRRDDAVVTRPHRSWEYSFCRRVYKACERYGEYAGSCKYTHAKKCGIRIKYRRPSPPRPPRPSGPKHPKHRPRESVAMILLEEKEEDDHAGDTSAVETLEIE